MIPSDVQCVFQGKIFDVYQREQEMFDGTTKTFEKITRSDTIDIVAIRLDGAIAVLDEQQPGREPYTGLVGGTCEQGEEPLQTARRELLEEVGCVSDAWELFGSYTVSSKIAYQSHIFIAQQCRIIDQQQLDQDGEKIDVRWLPWKEFVDVVADEHFVVKEFALPVLRAIYNGCEDELKDRIVGIS